MKVSTGLRPRPGQAASLETSQQPDEPRSHLSLSGEHDSSIRAPPIREAAVPVATVGEQLNRVGVVFALGGE